MAYAFEPINMELMKAIKPFGDFSNQYGAEISDDLLVRMPITVGELRRARRALAIGSDYKYDDRRKMIEHCAVVAETKGNSEIANTLRELIPVFTPSMV